MPEMPKPKRENIISLQSSITMSIYLKNDIILVNVRQTHVSDRSAVSTKSSQSALILRSQSSSGAHFLCDVFC